MNPLNKNKDFLQEAENYLTTLEKNKNKQYDFIVEMESYKHLGYSLLSILRVCQTALVTKDEEGFTRTLPENRSVCRFPVVKGRR